MGVASAARSDIGLRRQLNEDCILVGERIWVVADGMGGHASGDVASAYAVTSLREIDGMEDLKPADITGPWRREKILGTSGAIRARAGWGPLLLVSPA